MGNGLWWVRKFPGGGSSAAPRRPVPSCGPRTPTPSSGNCQLCNSAAKFYEVGTKPEQKDSIFATAHQVQIQRSVTRGCFVPDRLAVGVSWHQVATGSEVLKGLLVLTTRLRCLRSSDDPGWPPFPFYPNAVEKINV